MLFHAKNGHSSSSSEIVLRGHVSFFDLPRETKRRTVGRRKGSKAKRSFLASAFVTFRVPFSTIHAVESLRFVRMENPQSRIEANGDPAREDRPR